MKITKEQTDLIVAKLNACKDKRQPCPICGGTQWIISDTIFEIKEFNMGNMVIGGVNSAIMPMIPISCASCGHTRFLSAIKLGIINSQHEQKSDEAKQSK